MPERYDVLEAKGNKPMTEKEMMVKFWVDAKRREAEKLKHNVRPTSMKMKNGDVVQVMNYQTTLLLQRKFPEIFDRLKPFIEKFVKAKPPKRTSKQVQTPVNRKWILATTIYADTHFDKQGKQSMRTRKRNIIEADKLMLWRQLKYDPQKQLFVVLGDFFNTDGSYRTTKGTEQQNKVSEYEAWKQWAELLAEVLYNRSWFVDVDVILAQGNHDEHKLTYLRDLLHHYFQSNPKIKISQVSEDGRYYYKRGNNLLWFTHWHTARLNDLPWLMAWRWEKNKERYTGHRHKNIRQSYHGMQVNTLWAMSPWWEWNKRYAVDHANKQIYGVLHHNRDGKMWELYQKIK